LRDFIHELFPFLFRRDVVGQGVKDNIRLRLKFMIDTSETGGRGMELFRFGRSSQVLGERFMPRVVLRGGSRGEFFWEFSVF
jgi:hypothetical protein